MLESTFSEQRQQTSEESSQKSKMNKRWKTDLHSSLSTSTGDDADDDSYYMSLPVVKKSKGGVGYARDVKEDVSFYMNTILDMFFALYQCSASTILRSGAVCLIPWTRSLRFIDVLRPQYSGAERFVLFPGHVLCALSMFCVHNTQERFVLFPGHVLCALLMFCVHNTRGRFVLFWPRSKEPRAVLLASFLAMRCVEKAPQSVLELIKNDLRNEDSAVKITAIQCLDILALPDSISAFFVG
ncbi:hypothetical protein DEU56DRAFT_930529 [Suillus clintonianus]|uniref:uncharacterized protein n=1 Tax=Suillus clintonianus TaxID=1904413 RepID=UPI001B85B768|nr:uncharacterized protein DEU56DRAFT_930529 [Suillus clintonianus]KAG2118328.1 hypothetical protein DEU56DRAFT_930529 [Suillus clintonianus]